MSESATIIYRIVTDINELRAAVELQRVAWNQDTITSMPQMAAANLHGGVVIGAYIADTLIGFCYGFPGYDGERAYLASHMMAIDPDYRDRGIGMQLKFEQRTWAMENGYHKIAWTFDPFETRNGYLNLCKLGGTVRRYIPSFYGIDSQGLPVDRFMVEWELHTARVEKALAQQLKGSYDAVMYPSLLTYEAEGSQITAVRAQHAAAFEAKQGYLLPVPSDIRGLKQSRMELVAQWQAHLRHLCTAAFSQGYRVVALIRRNGLHQDYVLEPNTDEVNA